MISNEEREERKKCIGGSDIHKIMNFDSALCNELWEEKLGISENKDSLEYNMHIIAGNILEEDALKCFSNAYKIPITLNERVEHKTIKGFICSLDARSKDTVIENKIIGNSTWNKFQAKRKFNALYGETKLNISSNYYLQVQAQMSCTGYDKAILLLNILEDYQKLNCLETVITDIQQRPVEIKKDEKIIKEIENRAKFFIECLKYKKRPRETEFLERNLF